MAILAKYTIRAKLTIILMAVSSAVALLAGSAAFAIAAIMAIHGVTTDLTTLAQVLGDNCQAALTFTLPEDAEYLLSTLEKKPAIKAAAIYNADGGIFASYGTHGRHPPARLPTITASKVSWGSVEVVQPIRFKGKVIGHVYLRNDLSVAKPALARYAGAIVLVMLFSLAVAYFLALMLMGSISMPILGLAAVARAVSRGQDYSIRATRQSDDEVGELIGAFNNMLEQIQARDASLRASEEKFAQAFNLSPAMMILIDYESGMVRDVNAAWLALRGEGYQEVAGKKAEELEWVPDPAARALIMERIAQIGAARGVETTFRDRVGEERAVVLSAELIVIGGRRFIIAVGDDLTERRRMEEELLQAQKMEAVGRLAGGVAHDFNNVLAGMMNYAEMISLKAGATADLRKYADNIVQLAQRASGLTRQLLAFSRRGKIKEVKVDMHALVMEVTGLLEYTIDPRVHIHAELKAERRTVWGDPSQLQNAILNLAINARDAMPEGGTLSFLTETVGRDDALAAGVSEPVAAEYISLTVSDTGVGMPENVRNRVFEPFFTTKEFGKGTGLGLAAVYGTVKEHNGGIHVESEPGRGSSFQVILPLTEPEPRPDRAADGELIKGKGLVLLVDDEEALREVGRMMLEVLGFEVVEAKNGTEAISVFTAKKDELSLVILDVVMPEMTGIEAYAAIRAINPEVKVMISSGFMTDQQIKEIMEQGVRGVLMKPFSLSDLSAKLGEIMGRAG